jgi:hypothetical protein
MALSLQVFFEGACFVCVGPAIMAKSGSDVVDVLAGPTSMSEEVGARFTFEPGHCSGVFLGSPLPLRHNDKNSKFVNPISKK